MTAPQLARVRGGYRVKTEDGYHLDIRPMIGFFRLIEVSEENMHTIGRYWCFVSFEAAALAGAAWVMDSGTEPVGWFRHGGARN